MKIISLPSLCTKMLHRALYYFTASQFILALFQNYPLIILGRESLAIFSIGSFQSETLLLFAYCLLPVFCCNKLSKPSSFHFTTIPFYSQQHYETVVLCFQPVLFAFIFYNLFLQNVCSLRRIPHINPPFFLLRFTFCHHCCPFIQQ